MINKVFCYSTEEAKKHKNHTSFGKMILHTALMTSVFSVVMVVLMAMIEDLSGPRLLAITALFMAYVVYYAIRFGKNMRTQLIAFAADEENNIYCVTQLVNVGNVASTNGKILAVYLLNNSAKLMQSAELITKTVESAENATGVDVKQILKVYSYTQDKHKVKVKCDYKIMRGGKVETNKTLTIYKSYNNFVDLMNIILTKK